MLELTTREQKRYSIRRAISTEAERRMGNRSANCFEFEISQELEKQLGEIHSGYERHGGVLVPTGIALDGGARARWANYQERAGLDTSTATKGQELTFDEFGSFIDLLRPNSWILTFGATFLSGLKGDIGFPREKTPGLVTWGVENPGVDTPAQDMTLDRVWLTPRTAQTTTSFSRQLLAQSVPSVDGVVANDIARNHAVALDQAAINGTAPAPTGILNQLILTSDFAASLSTNFDNVVAMESALYVTTTPKKEPRPAAALAYMADPLTGAFMKSAAQSPTVHVPMWYDGRVNNRRAEMSVLMPSPGLLFGDWADLLVGEWGVLEIITDPYAKKKQGMIEVTSFYLADVELRHLESFVKATNLALAAAAAAPGQATKEGKK